MGIDAEFDYHFYEGGRLQPIRQELVPTTIGDAPSPHLMSSARPTDRLSEDVSGQLLSPSWIMLILKE